MKVGNKIKRKFSTKKKMKEKIIKEKKRSSEVKPSREISSVEGGRRDRDYCIIPRDYDKLKDKIIVNHGFMLLKRVFIIFFIISFLYRCFAFNGFEVFSKLFFVLIDTGKSRKLVNRSESRGIQIFLFLRTKSSLAHDLTDIFRLLRGLSVVQVSMNQKVSITKNAFCLKATWSKKFISC